jgi:hypothetical protein
MRTDKYEQRKKRMSVILTIGIAFIMVASIFAIVIDNQSQTIPDYNKHKFVLGSVGYKTKISGQYMEFYYYPSDLERINLNPDITAKLKNSQGVAFVFNPTENVSENLQYIDLIRYDLETQLDKPAYFGITINSSKYALPVISCANATPEFPFVLINISSDTSLNISSEYPNCIIMNAKLKELLAAKDRLLYAYYGIMS